MQVQSHQYRALDFVEVVEHYVEESLCWHQLLVWVHMHTCLRVGGHGCSWACLLVCITVLYMCVYILHVQCKIEINPTFFLEGCDTILCKVIGNVASAGLQLCSCWKGRQTAQVKNNIYFSVCLGPASTEENRKSQNAWCVWTAVFAPDSPLCGYNLYIWVKNLSPQMQYALTPLLLTCLKTSDFWETETWILPFPWLPACSTLRWASALPPSQKQWFSTE